MAVPWWKSATCFTIPNSSHSLKRNSMARLDNHVEHSCVLNGRSLPLVEDSPCDSDPKISPILTSFFFHPKCRWHSCFFFKIQIHHKSQGCIETYRWAEPPCSCKDGVHQQVDCGDVLSNKPSITKMEASTSHPLANWLLNFEEANIDESGLETNCDASQKKSQTNPDGGSFQTRICNYHQVSTIFLHDRLGCICM